MYAPQNGSVTYVSASGRITSLTISQMPVNTAKVLIGSSATVRSDRANFLFAMFDTSGVPIGNFAPVTMVAAITGFRGPAARITNTATRQDSEGVQMMIGMYAFPVVSDFEHVIYDLYVNGIGKIFRTSRPSNMTSNDAFRAPLSGGYFIN
jgi:hypothetical protein